MTIDNLYARVENVTMTTTTKPNYSGLRSWHKARSTGATVAVYDGTTAEMDTDAGRWQTVCETHGSVISHRTIALAKYHAAAPEEWCEGCAG